MKKLVVVLAIVAMCGSIAQAGTGSCTAGSFTVSFSGANFVTGLGWSSGGSRTINFSGSCSGCNLGPIVYGWGTNPLVEYYIGRGGGSSAGSYSTSKGSFTLYTNSCNGPNVTGSGSFTQYNCSGSGGSGQPMGDHYSGWRNLGKGTSEGGGYCIVMAESWSGGSGSATISVPNSSFYSHWVGSGSATFTCGGGGSTTTTSATSTSTTTTSGSTTTTSGGSTTTSGGGVDCSGLPTWSSSTIYSTAGTKVQYNSKAYSNKWYTQGQNPETNSGQWQVWTLLGTCGGGATTTTAAGTTSTTTTAAGTTTTVAGTTTTSGGGTAPCSSPSSISAPFTQNGSGTFCFSLTSCSYINSWNLAELNVNGTNLTNKYVGSGQMPAKIDGKWIIKYVGNYSWSHFEVK